MRGGSSAVPDPGRRGVSRFAPGTKPGKSLPLPARARWGRGRGCPLFDKVGESHVVPRADGLPALLSVALPLVHEAPSPQAFESLRIEGRPGRRPDPTPATMDHNAATGDDTPMDE